MPLLENKFLCNHHLVIPKIVMSTYNKTDTTTTEEALQLNNKNQCNLYLTSPEIRCSPSPCVFDSCDNHTVNRTPSPAESDCSPRFRRRSLRRSASPVRRGSVLAPGYEQYQKSLLEVPASTEYGDASSDDLSSEWDSDVPDVPRSDQPKVRMISFLWRV